MGHETAAALARRIGLQTLATVHADALWLYGDAFRVSAGKAAVPGGVAAAEEVWTKLVGSSPQDPVRFFEALLKADRGRLAAFYAALSQADAAHQRFFLKDMAHARRYYAWYHDSEELRAGIGRPANVWRPMVFRNLSLDETGDIRFPGGRAAWSAAGSDDEALLPTLFEALLEIDRLERERGIPLDTDSAKLLVRNFVEWRSLFPYIAALPGLGARSSRPSTHSPNSAAGYVRPAQNVVLGQWHSLAALIVLGSKAGSLDDAAAARAFGRVCRSLASKDHSASALAALRAIAGGSANLTKRSPAVCCA